MWRIASLFIVRDKDEEQVSCINFNFKARYNIAKMRVELVDAERGGSVSLQGFHVGSPTYDDLYRDILLYRPYGHVRCGEGGDALVAVPDESYKFLNMIASITRCSYDYAESVQYHLFQVVDFISEDNKTLLNIPTGRDGIFGCTLFDYAYATDRNWRDNGFHIRATYSLYLVKFRDIDAVKRYMLKLRMMGYGNPLADKLSTLTAVMPWMRE